jgi:hypothetical protein
MALQPSHLRFARLKESPPGFPLILLAGGALKEGSSVSMVQANPRTCSIPWPLRTCTPRALTQKATHLTLDENRAIATKAFIDLPTLFPFFTPLVPSQPTCARQQGARHLRDVATTQSEQIRSTNSLSASAPYSLAPTGVPS